MNIINGSDENGLKTDQERVLSEFYFAFNNQRLDLMKENWSAEGEPIMSNPLGGIKSGWLEIEQVYKNIFNGPADVFVEFYDYQIHSTENMFCAAGRERGYFKTAAITIELSIRTSRVYQVINGVWRQLHHHGSIDQPELLEQYQSALKKNRSS